MPLKAELLSVPAQEEGSIQPGSSTHSFLWSWAGERLLADPSIGAAPPACCL